jgi:hypothetical protein
VERFKSGELPKHVLLLLDDLWKLGENSQMYCFKVVLFYNMRSSSNIGVAMQRPSVFCLPQIRITDPEKYGVLVESVEVRAMVEEPKFLVNLVMTVPSLLLSF